MSHPLELELRQFKESREEEYSQDYTGQILYSPGIEYLIYEAVGSYWLLTYFRDCLPIIKLNKSLHQQHFWQLQTNLQTKEAVFSLFERLDLPSILDKETKTDIPIERIIFIGKYRNEKLILNLFFEE